MMMLEVEWKEILGPLNERNSANMQERINKCYIIVIRDMAFNLIAIKETFLVWEAGLLKAFIAFWNYIDMIW